MFPYKRFNKAKDFIIGASADAECLRKVKISGHPIFHR